MNTLIIWDNWGSEHKLYLIPNSEIDSQKRELLLNAHGRWDGIEGTYFIYNTIQKDLSYCLNGDESYFCIWKDREISIEDVAKHGQNIDCVIIAGFK